MQRTHQQISEPNFLFSFPHFPFLATAWPCPQLPNARALKALNTSLLAKPSTLFSVLRHMNCDDCSWWPFPPPSNDLPLVSDTTFAWFFFASSSFLNSISTAQSINLRASQGSRHSVLCLLLSFLSNTLCPSVFFPSLLLLFKRDPNGSWCGAWYQDPGIRPWPKAGA